MIDVFCGSEILMEAEKARAGKKTMTFEEATMESSKSFVTALQELKNLRPQLYSAAEYCEKSYLKSEQKQMVLDNLKDYAMRALVNIIDHLGTVAYKMNDVLEQQTSEISSIASKVTCINQQLLTCQTYTDKEGLRQQQLLAIIPKHHKHYTLPNSVNKKVHFSPYVHMDSRQAIQVKGRRYPSGVSAPKTLSWHLASETKSTMQGSSQGFMSAEDSKMNGKTSGAVTSLDAPGNKRMKSTPATRVAMQTLGVTRRDASEGPKTLTSHRSLEKLHERAIIRQPVRSKSMLSVFFAKQKTPILRKRA